MLTKDKEDHKPTLCYDLEKDLREVFEEFSRKKQSMRAVGQYAKGLLVIMHRYKEPGLDWEDIREVRERVVNG